MIDSAISGTFTTFSAGVAVRSPNPAYVLVGTNHRIVAGPCQFPIHVLEVIVFEVMVSMSEQTDRRAVI